MWLLLAVVVIIICVVVNRTLRLPMYAAMPLTLSPAMLVLFPFLKRSMPRLPSWSRLYRHDHRLWSRCGARCAGGGVQQQELVPPSLSVPP